MAPSTILYLSKPLPHAAGIEATTLKPETGVEGLQAVFVDESLGAEDLARAISDERSGSVIVSYGPAAIGSRFPSDPDAFALKLFENLRASAPAVAVCADGDNATLWAAIGFCAHVAMCAGPGSATPDRPRVYILARGKSPRVI